MYDDRHRLTTTEIETLLRAAQWAPSAGNSQPWVVFVCVPGTANHDRLVATLSRGNSGWVPRASVVLLTAAHVRTGDEPDAPAYSDYALHDVGQAAAHLTLQARAMGLHAHQFAGFDHAEFAERLGIPSSHRVLTGVAIGRLGDPAKVPDAEDGILAKDLKPRRRRELGEQAFEGTWGTPWAGLETP